MARLHILEDALARMFGEVTRKAVAADLHANRKTTYADNASRRYHQYANGKGQRVRFFRAVHRNIAGYFLIWRETTMKNGKVKNDMLRAFKCKAKAKAANEARWKKAVYKGGKS